MKHELGITKPDYLVEDWPGKFEVFSWLDYVVTIPNPIYLVTTRKTNGAPNACLHAWGQLIGEKDRFYSLLIVHPHAHTAENIRREREWVINFPTARDYPRCFKTIECNGPENDEITDAGMTVEPSQKVRAPRIAECAVNLECRLEWDRPLLEGSALHLFMGQVVHAAMEESVMVTDPAQRMAALNLMYNIRGTVNPLDGSYYGPSTLGILNQVMKISPE